MKTNGRQHLIIGNCIAAVSAAEVLAEAETLADRVTLLAMKRFPPTPAAS